jgi:hypothetical protein
MKDADQRGAAPVMWMNSWRPYMRYEAVSDDALLEAGIVTEHDLPGRRYKCATNAPRFKLHRRKDGLLNGSFDADLVLARDSSFNRFLDRVLTDVQRRR